jgi:hypothetical protein
MSADLDQLSSIAYFMRDHLDAVSFAAGTLIQ